MRPVLPYVIPDCIKKITFAKTLDGAPANSYLDGELILDPSFFKLPIDTQRFIVAHEGGHIANNSTNELDADAWGFNWYVNNGGSLMMLVASLADVLSFKSPEHLQRTKAMYERCAQYDRLINNNTMVSSISINTGANSLFGFTPLKNLQTAFDKYQERKDIKTDAKAQKKINTSEAKIIRAQTGQTFGSTVGGYSSGLMDLAGNLFGGKQATNVDASVPTKKDNTTTIVLIALGVLVVGVAAYYFIVKRK
jgi:hypothetical protein